MADYLNIDNDLSLFALIKQGDAAAFETIYNQYWTILFNTAFKRLADKDKCQDIVQNIFTDLWNRRAELTIKNPQAYLQTAVRFQTLKAISRQANQTSFTEHFETNIISSLQTDGHLLEKEAKALIGQFIEALPAKRRNIFVMHYFDGLNTAKIAHELNISQKTVQNQLTTASHAVRFRFAELFGYTIVLVVIFY